MRRGRIEPRAGAGQEIPRMAKVELRPQAPAHGPERWIGLMTWGARLQIDDFALYREKKPAA